MQLNEKQIKEIQKNLRIMANAYPNSMILPMQSYAKQMHAICAPIQKIMANIDFEKIAKLAERLDNLKKSDFEYKWLQSIFIPFGNKLMELYEKGGNKEVNKFLIELFRDKKNVESFKEWLKNQPAYEERKRIIDDCLQAHLETKFTLAIPCLLAQCDGIIINKVVEKAKYTGKDAKSVNMKKVAKDGKIPMNPYFSQHLIVLYDTKRLNILHGKDIDYYKNGEELSVKAIWTLFEIIHFASEIK